MLAATQGCQKSRESGRIPQGEGQLNLSDSMESIQYSDSSRKPTTSIFSSRKMRNATQSKFRLDTLNDSLELIREDFGPDLQTPQAPSSDPLSQSSMVRDGESSLSKLTETVVERKCRRHVKKLGKHKMERGQTKPDSKNAESTRSWSGNALQYLAGNPLRDHIEALIMDDQIVKKDEAARQLRSAIMGGSAQCSNCEKYMPSKKYSYAHKARCQGSELIYRVSFAKIEGKYFCYFGCSRLNLRAELLVHLMEEHKHQLQAWGLSSRLLAQPSMTTPEGPRVSVEGSQIDTSKQQRTQPQTLPGQRSDPDEKTPDEISSGNLPDQNIPVVLEDNVLIKFIVKNSQIAAASDRFTKGVVTFKQLRFQGMVYSLYNLNWLRSDVMTAFRVITNLQKTCQMANRQPQLDIQPVSLSVHQSKVVSVKHSVDMKTPVMFYRQNLHQDARRVFSKILLRLLYFHKEWELFQGGVTLSNIGLTSTGDAYFLEWTHSAFKSGFQTRIKPTSKSYWKQAHLKRDEDLYILDLLALLFTYGEFISYLNNQPSYFETIGRWNLGLLYDPHKTIENNLSSSMFAGSELLNILLMRYSSEMPIDYEEVKTSLLKYFAEDVSDPEDPFAGEWVDEKTHKEELAHSRLGTSCNVEVEEVSISDEYSDW